MFLSKRSDEAPTGPPKNVAQLPRAGTRAQQGQTVALKVSSGGKKSSLQPPKGSVVVPNVVGLSQRDAVARTECPVRLPHRLAAAVRQHEVVARHEGAQRVLRVRLQAVQRRGRVHVPEHADRAVPCRFHRAGQQRVIEHAHTTRLHDDVSFARLLHDRAQSVARHFNSFGGLT